MRSFALALTFSLAFVASACDKPSTDGPSPDGPEGPGCTEDAKLCPDGSAVGRSGPDCEFDPCPGEAPPPDGGAEGGAEGGDEVVCTMDAKICPDGTGVGRVGPNCEFAPCPGE